MIDDRDDSVLDSLLEEALGAQTPPDLAPRILQAWEQGEAAHAPEPPPILTGVQAGLVDTVPNSVVELRRSSSHDRQATRSFSGLTPAIAASCAISLGLLIGIVAVVNSNRPQVAHDARRPPVEAPPSAPMISNESVASSSIDSSPIVPPVVVENVPQLPAPPSTAPGASQLASNQASEVAAPSIPSPPVLESSPPKRSLHASPDAQIVSFVNAEFNRTWADAGVKPAPAASDAEWCQRLFVRLIGRLPNQAELTAFLDNGSTDRHEQLVRKLLTDGQYVQAYARHWATLWASALTGRAPSGSLASREDLEKYFVTALAASKPFNQIARELLTATGSARPGASDYNPAVNFLLDAADANAIVPTSRVARVLLGHQLQCAQCHAHPSQAWSQEQFWALNSFFRQMRVERQADNARLVNADFPGQGRGSRDGEVYFETPDGLMKTAFPRFLDGTEIPKSGELAAVDRRRELARLVAESDDLSKALVNRVWAQFFDYGFTRPVDDLGPKAVVSQPQVLERLATEFAAHDYDLQALIRWTVLSDPFNRSNKITDLVSKDMPEDGELALFSRYYARPAQTADVFGALVQAGRIRKAAPSEAEREKARVDWLAQFNRGMAKGGPKTKAGEPALLVKNSEPIRRTSGNEAGGLLKKVAASSMSFDKKLEHLFLAAVARQPTPREQRAAAELVKLGGDEAAALEDAWWALVSSSECTLDR